MDRNNFYDSVQSPNAELFIFLDARLNELESRLTMKIDQKINQLTDEMKREFRDIPACMKEYIYLDAGKHCNCCSQVKKLQRNNSKAPIAQPYSKESSGKIKSFSGKYFCTYT